MRHLLLIALALLLFACGAGPLRQADPPHMSVEQAKNVTADFGAREIPAPPRAITDVIAILDQQKPDETYRAAVQAKLQATPPVGASAADRSEFYGVRADTAMQAG